LKKLALLLIMLIIFPGSIYSPVRAGSQDFTLINKTGVDICHLYISPANSTNWGKDLLGGSVLDQGGNIYVRFSVQPEIWWDLMIKDQNEHSVYWENLNLSLITQLTLYSDGLYVWAEYQ
jgi:hypothetical protein